MAESWGNGTATRHNEDLVSNPANKNILKINDVNDNDDDKIALETINSSTDADARGLKVEGKSELDGDIFTTVDSYATLKINDVNDSNDDKTALHVINSSSDADARSAKVEGTLDVQGRSVEHRAKIIVDQVKVNGIAGGAGLEIDPLFQDCKVSIGPSDGQGLSVLGDTSLTGQTFIHGGPLFVQGTDATHPGDGIFQGRVTAIEHILVGDAEGVLGGRIDANADDEEERDLSLGIGDTTDEANGAN